MISLGSLDEAKTLAQLAQNPSAISINAIVTTFRLAKKAQPPTSHADGTKTWNLPLIFEVVADISIHNNKTSTLMMTSSGSISGTFGTSSSTSSQDNTAKSSSSYLLKDAIVTIDTITLLTAMVTQARKVAKVAVRHLAEIIGSAAAKERENGKKRAAAIEAYKQRQQKEEEEEKRLFQLLKQHNQMQPMQQQQQQQQPPLSDLIDLNQLHSILSQSGSSASSTANMASLASVASLLNGPYGRSEHNLGGGMLAGHYRGNLLQSGTKNQSFFSISNNNNNSNSNKPFTAPESLSNLQPLPFISTNNFHKQNNHQMQQINTNDMQSNANNLNQLFPTLPTSYEPQNQRRLSQEETRKMIDSTEGLPSSLAQVAAELRVETEAGNKKRRAKRRRSSAESNATADSSSSYQFSLDTITTGCNEGEAQPLTLSTLFAKQDEMFEEERRKRSATETLVGCTQNNSGNGGIGDRGAVQGSSTLNPTASGVSTTTQNQLLALLKRVGPIMLQWKLLPTCSSKVPRKIIIPSRPR